MNPIYQWIVQHTSAKALLRRCPNCGGTQKVRRDQQALTVPYRRCGADVPPGAHA